MQKSRLQQQGCRRSVQRPAKIGGTHSQTHLTEYYNEFVLQLKLAEYNYNETISMEIKDNYTTEALDNEEIVIKILKESILPALEFMASCK